MPSTVEYTFLTYFVFGFGGLVVFVVCFVFVSIHSGRRQGSRGQGLLSVWATDVSPALRRIQGQRMDPTNQEPAGDGFICLKTL